MRGRPRYEFVLQPLRVHRSIRAPFLGLVDVCQNSDLWRQCAHPLSHPKKIRYAFGVLRVPSRDFADRSIFAINKKRAKYFPHRPACGSLNALLPAPLLELSQRLVIGRIDTDNAGAARNLLLEELFSDLLLVPAVGNLLRQMGRY